MQHPYWMHTLCPSSPRTRRNTKSSVERVSSPGDDTHCPSRHRSPAPHSLILLPSLPAHSPLQGRNGPGQGTQHGPAGQLGRGAADGCRRTWGAAAGRGEPLSPPAAPAQGRHRDPPSPRHRGPGVPAAPLQPQPQPGGLSTTTIMCRRGLHQTKGEAIQQGYKMTGWTEGKTDRPHFTHRPLLPPPSSACSIPPTPSSARTPSDRPDQRQSPHCLWLLGSPPAGGTEEVCLPPSPYPPTRKKSAFSWSPSPSQGVPPAGSVPVTSRDREGWWPQSHRADQSPHTPGLAACGSGRRGGTSPCHGSHCCGRWWWQQGRHKPSPCWGTAPTDPAHPGTHWGPVLFTSFSALPRPSPTRGPWLQAHFVFLRVALGWDHSITGWLRLEAPPEVTLPKPLCQKGHPEPAAQVHAQAAFEYLHGWRLHHLPGQPVPVLGHPDSAEAFPDVQRDPPVPQFVLMASGPIPGHPWAEPGCVLSAPSLQVSTRAGEIPRACSAPGCPAPAPPASPRGRDAPVPPRPFAGRSPVRPRLRRTGEPSAGPSTAGVGSPALSEGKGPLPGPAVTLLLPQPGTLLAITAGSWSAWCPPVPPGPVPRSCFPAGWSPTHTSADFRNV